MDFLVSIAPFVFLTIVLSGLLAFLLYRFRFIAGEDFDLPNPLSASPAFKELPEVVVWRNSRRGSGIAGLLLLVLSMVGVAIDWRMTLVYLSFPTCLLAWYYFISPASIRFEERAILFESWAQIRFGWGRVRRIPYQNVFVVQSTRTQGDRIVFYYDRKRIQTITIVGWNRELGQIIDQIRRRLSPSQYMLHDARWN